MSQAPNIQSAARVGVVVIGRNEGERLVRCLRSVMGDGRPVVYVDSNSADGSVAVAEGLGVRTITLRTGPFTAARGRQAGFEALLDAHPGLEFVMFIDGDCVMDAGWLPAAAAFMDTHPRCGAISGRRREEHADGSFWARLIDLDWDAPPGRVGYPGGDSLCRVAAVRDVGGWTTGLIAGEDPDLGFRMNDAKGGGWEVHRLGAEMTLHDMRMRSFREYWRRAVRSGHAYTEVGWAHRRGAGAGWWRRTLGVMFYGAAAPLLIAALAWFYWPAAALLSLLYVRIMLVMVRSCRAKGAGWGTAMAYAALNTVCKAGCAIGGLRYVLGRVTGRRAALIEYRAGAGAAATGEAIPGSGQMS